MEQSKEEIDRAQHEINRAEATHAALHADYTRLLETSKAQPGLIAQQELDDAQAKDLSSDAQVDAAKAAHGRGTATCRSGPLGQRRACRRFKTTPMSSLRSTASSSGAMPTLGP